MWTPKIGKNEENIEINVKNSVLKSFKLYQSKIDKTKKIWTSIQWISEYYFKPFPYKIQPLQAMSHQIKGILFCNTILELVENQCSEILNTTYIIFCYFTLFTEKSHGYVIFSITN